LRHEARLNAISLGHMLFGVVGTGCTGTVTADDIIDEQRIREKNCNKDSSPPWLHVVLQSALGRVSRDELSYTVTGLSALENGLRAGVTLRLKRSTAATKSRRLNVVCEETVDDLIQKLSAERTEKTAKK
jgi:hypothetical protein